MEESECAWMIFMVAAFGLVGLDYAPEETHYLLGIVTLLAAFFLVFGLITTVFGFFTGISTHRKYWLEGFLLLIIIGVVFGKKQLAVNAVQLMVSLFVQFLNWVFSVA